MISPDFHAHDPRKYNQPLTNAQLAYARSQPEEIYWLWHEARCAELDASDALTELREFVADVARGISDLNELCSRVRDLT